MLNISLIKINMFSTLVTQLFISITNSKFIHFTANLKAFIDMYQSSDRMVRCQQTSNDQSTTRKGCVCTVVHIFQCQHIQSPCNWTVQSILPGRSCIELPRMLDWLPNDFFLSGRHANFVRLRYVSMCNVIYACDKIPSLHVHEALVTNN